MPKFTTIEGRKSPGDPKNILKKPKLFVINQGDGRKRGEINPETKIEITKNSLIEQNRMFSKAEIVNLMHDIAREERVEKNELYSEKEVYDKNGNLIIIDMMVVPDKIRKLGWGNIKYSFMIKGSCQTKNGRQGSLYGGVFRFNAPIDSPDEYITGDEVARYDEVTNKWKLKTGGFAMDLELA